MFFNINVSIIDLQGTHTAGSFWFHSAEKVLVCVLIKNTGICSLTLESNQHKAFPKLVICNLLENINGGLNHVSKLHLSLFSIYTGNNVLHFQVDCPFIVCMTYAFHTPDKLCFILDLMNGGDLHYHLSQHGVFNEHEMKFYAAEVILGEFRVIWCVC